MRRVLSSLVALGIAAALAPALFVRRDTWLQEQIDLLNHPQEHGAAAERLLMASHSAVSALIAALEDHDPQIAPRAAEVLGQIGDRRAVEPLCAALNGTTHDLRVAAAKALGSIGDERAIEDLGRAAEARNSAAVMALAAIGTPAARLRLSIARGRHKLARIHASRRRPGWPRGSASHFSYRDGFSARRLVTFFAQAQAKWGPAPDIERAIAECHLVMGQYAEAADGLRRYLEAKPDDGEARELLAEAEHEAALLARAQPYLPSRYVAYKALECDVWGRGARDLLVLAASRIEWSKCERPGDWPDTMVEDCHLAVLRPQGERYELAWLSPTIGVRRRGKSYWYEMGLWAEDIDGDGDQDILVGASVPTAKRQGSHTAVFSPVGRSLRRTVSAGSGGQPSVMDLDGDGDMELTVSYMVGS
ncbi:MAG: HEAT repeat domain-containing protein, partial [Armatimonadota bacterium]